MTAEELVAIVEGREIGRIGVAGPGRHRFTYDAAWRSASSAFPLSLSMPLAAAEHRHAAIAAFLWGLLPDNGLILERWAKRFQVSARNPFDLIASVGEDCAGAVQFVRPERLFAVRAEAPAKVDWLSEADLADRLRALRADIAAWRRPDEPGQFSLAGAQAKTALLFARGRWGIPSGRLPTTHIVKPPSAEFDGHAENEHVCLVLARALGLPAAASRIVRFEGEVAIAVERFDRAIVPGPSSVRTELPRILRLHQEDLCQALGMPPTSKYQNEGGPSPERIIELLRLHSSRAPEDIATFVDALAFNWLIAGTDAHAKNYALLHGAGGRVRLAPLYDLASALPYDRLDPRKMKLAMKIGGEYRLEGIVARHWLRLCEGARLDIAPTMARIADLARKLPAALAAVGKAARTGGIRHPIVSTMVKRLSARAAQCAAALDARA